MPEDARKRNDRQYAWQKENTDRINFTMPKGRKDQIKEAAEIAGVSATVWINQAIDAKFEDAGIAAPKDMMDLGTIKDLEAYARSAGKTSAEYVREAVREKMERQDADFQEDVERVDITSF